VTQLPLYLSLSLLPFCPTLCPDLLPSLLLQHSEQPPDDMYAVCLLLPLRQSVSFFFMGACVYDTLWSGTLSLVCGVG